MRCAGDCAGPGATAAALVSRWSSSVAKCRRVLAVGALVVYWETDDVPESSPEFER